MSNPAGFNDLPCEVQRVIFDIAAWISYESVCSFIYRVVAISTSSFDRDWDLVMSHRTNFEKHCTALYVLIWEHAYKYKNIWTILLPMLPRLIHLQAFCSIWTDNNLHDQGITLSQLEVLQAASRSSFRYFDMDWHLNLAFSPSSPVQAPLVPSVTHLTIDVYRLNDPSLNILRSFPALTHILITASNSGDVKYQNDFIEAVADLPHIEVLVVSRGDRPTEPPAYAIPHQKVVYLERPSGFEDFFNIVSSAPESVWAVADAIISKRSGTCEL
ncbi:hypothetical protein DL96DRAFT_1710980 [Flagelloscypha sp. PMI_526]|nr:hypothetical protein DL96DRAFT_1710980 [Flagelloscypha sp. PMI_526]